jgi:hypothetical protein
MGEIPVREAARGIRTPVPADDKSEAHESPFSAKEGAVEPRRCGRAEGDGMNMSWVVTKVMRLVVDGGEIFVRERNEKWGSYEGRGTFVSRVFVKA